MCSDRWRSGTADPCTTSLSLSSLLSDTSFLFLLLSSFFLLLCCFCFFFWWRKNRMSAKLQHLAKTRRWAKWFLLPSCPSCVCAASCPCVSSPCSAFWASVPLLEGKKWRWRPLCQGREIIYLYIKHNNYNNYRQHEQISSELQSFNSFNY